MPAARPFLPALVLPALLAGCAAGPVAPATGGEATVEGRVASVDTAPWAYDGSAIVVIDGTAAGRVRVELPARWNLCSAHPLPDLSTLRPGERVRATGTTGEDGTLVVCAQPTHELRRLD